MERCALKNTKILLLKWKFRSWPRHLPPCCSAIITCHCNYCSMPLHANYIHIYLIVCFAILHLTRQLSELLEGHPGGDTVGTATGVLVAVAFKALGCLSREVASGVLSGRAHTCLGGWDSPPNLAFVFTPLFWGQVPDEREGLEARASAMSLRGVRRSSIAKINSNSTQCYEK
ncbi:hypothetical protein HJG60_010390 [Phyllostomus discolor]|uniref:Uncharacterized protein n=1 Tax=Phyllostomus discolor TaxID=89673 RepID=A0A834EKC2_9CHIR|nr:hypothetical protein HJG60_010390 [Phyllostomus discolor]